MEDKIYKKLSEDLEKELEELKEKSQREIEFYKKSLLNRPHIHKLTEKIFWRFRRMNTLLSEICGIISPSPDNFEKQKQELDCEIQETVFDNCCLDIISCLNQTSLPMDEILKTWKEKFTSLDWKKFKFEER